MSKKATLPQILKNILEKGDKIYQPGISVDCTIFGFHENVLKVLLLKVKQSNKWALPGGFIYIDEPIEKAANRVLKERTGVNNIFLQHKIHNQMSIKKRAIIANVKRNLILSLRFFHKNTLSFVVEVEI